jgi:hypothetical protein
MNKGKEKPINGKVSLNLENAKTDGRRTTDMNT